MLSAFPLAGGAQYKLLNPAARGAARELTDGKLTIAKGNLANCVLIQEVANLRTL